MVRGQPPTAAEPLNRLIASAVRPVRPSPARRASTVIGEVASEKRHGITAGRQQRLPDGRSPYFARTCISK